jgi:hypothetical protein
MTQKNHTGFYVGVPILSRTFDKKFFTFTNICKGTLDICTEAGRISLHVKFTFNFLDLNQNRNLLGIFVYTSIPYFSSCYPHTIFLRHAVDILEIQECSWDEFM